MTVDEQILRAARLGWPRRVIARHLGITKVATGKVIEKARAQGECLPDATGFKWDGQLNYAIPAEQMARILERSLTLGITPSELIDKAIASHVNAPLVAPSADAGRVV